ncbi:MAG: NAD(P)/FAD-dependent oxidoreductase [Flavobacteriales bacterium]|nr:NAD(P)/FAD-dependent oxidoreductase [Flavobacteriales bacterium]
MKIAVIGGGAAGFFAAISVKENHPNAEVIIYEKSQKLLSKVKVSGGGRCNVTNGCTSISELSKAYPRGGKKLKKAFNIFNTKHTFEWFENRGVPLMTEKDGRAFPTTQRSQTIVDCFLREVEKLNIRIKLGHSISGISLFPDSMEIAFQNEIQPSKKVDKVIVACGGSPNRKGLEWLERMGHEIVDPIPSLFTFNMPKEPITELMGVVADNAIASIEGTKLRSEGPLLITHWGMSGPAILKLSAFGARVLSQLNYRFNVQVNWAGEANQETVKDLLREAITEHPNRILVNQRPFSLPERLWVFLLQRSGINERKKWCEVGKNGLNKLTSVLTNDVYPVSGKTTFKEEFVTCGGISLESVDFKTMQSKVSKNLYFSGEILDIDGITGGYNFQAAWTTAFIAGKLN